MELSHHALVHLSQTLFAMIALQLALGGMPALAATNDPIQMTWTTDSQYTLGSSDTQIPTTFGPDGPWQAVVVKVGNYGPANNNSLGYDEFESLPVPLYPCGAGITQLLTSATGGEYDIMGDNASKSVVRAGNSVGNPDDWFASVLLNSTSSGTEVLDFLALPTTLGQGDANTNATIFAATQQWDISLPNGKSYPNQVGTLGLGRLLDLETDGNVFGTNPSLLDQIREGAGIASSSFGLHLGSAVLNSTPSLTLGGYDQARALGPVGGFWYQQGIPFALLEDINLGVVTGGSPFNSNNTKNLYLGSGNSDTAEVIRRSLGAPEGSTVIIPNPAFPYISLPPGNCEAVAKFLPVTWQPDIGFFTWNVADPQYHTIVSSPAYMEFILADKQAFNLSVKVPFRLLNLTLDSPIVDTPTPYFPCQPYDSSYGFWSLGRAFLQSAFLGVNYDQNITWLAQAPGPSPDQLVLKTINPGDTNITTNSIKSFETSWANHWEVLASNGLNTTDIPTSTPTGVSGGAIAGIVVGCIVALAVVSMLAWKCCSHRRRRAGGSRPSAGSHVLLPQDESGSGDGAITGSSVHEAPGGRDPLEVGHGLPHEVETKEMVAEVGGLEVHELPTERRW